MDLTVDSAAGEVERFISAIPPCSSARMAGRGIICVSGGRRYQACAYVLFNLLRELGCTLPIHSYYLGPEEQDDRWERLMEPLRVCVQDLRANLARHPHPRLNGWESKPYGLLHSPFEEVLLLDADIVPVRDPTFLFESQEFQQAGAVLWPDRPASFSAECFRVFGNIPPRPIRPVESGQVLCNKRVCWNQVHLTNFYNEHSSFFYRYVHGDKDTFLMAWEKLGKAPARVPEFSRDSLDQSFIQPWFDGEPLFWHVGAGTSRKLAPFMDPAGLPPEFPHRARVIELLKEFGNAMTWTDCNSTGNRKVAFRRRLIKTRHEHAFNGCLGRRSTTGSLLVYRSDPGKLVSCFVSASGEVLPESYSEFPISDNVDPRLVRFDGRDYMSTSYCGYGYDCERVELWPLEITGTSVQPVREGHLVFEGVENDPTYVLQREKNWTPWVWNNQLFFTHKIQPHRICEVDFANQCVRLRHESQWSAESWKQEWGREFRGNCSPVRLPDGRFLSVFHTVGSGGYYSGFFTFENVAPFRVSQISRVPFLRPEDGTGTNWRTGSQCIFILSLEVENNIVRLCGGDNDHSIVVIETNLDDVLQSLVPVTPTDPATDSGIRSRCDLFTIRKSVSDIDVTREIYFSNEYHLPERLDCQVIVDIGAHIGAFACRCLDRGAARVICFEPSEGNLHILRQNLSAYGDRAEIRPLPVGPSNGIRTIHFLERRYREHSNSSIGVQGRSLDCVEFDSILRELGGVDVLKLDCEGMEYPLLYTSARLDLVKLIVGEWHHIADRNAIDPALGACGNFSKEGLQEFFANSNFALQFHQDHGSYGIFTAARQTK